MEPNLAIAHGRIFLKGCWKDFVRPLPDGSRPAKAMMEEKYPEDATKL